MSNNELRHYGVKGMKWRKHKARMYLDDYHKYDTAAKKNQQAADAASEVIGNLKNDYSTRTDAINKWGEYTANASANRINADIANQYYNRAVAKEWASFNRKKRARSAMRAVNRGTHSVKKTLTKFGKITLKSLKSTIKK